MKPTIKIIIAMTIWGSIGIFVRNIDLPSLEIAFMRAVIASLILSLSIVIIRPTKKLTPPPLEKSNTRILILSGILLAGNWVFLFQAYKYTSIANATLSYYAAPVLAVLLSPLVIADDKFTAKKVYAVSIAMLGLYFIVNQQSLVANGTYLHFKGISYGLCAALMYAGVVLCNKKMAGLKPVTRVLTQMLVSAILLLPLVISRGQLHFNNTESLIYLILLGLVHTGLAYLLYFPSIEHVSVMKASILSYIDTVTAVIFAALLLGEPLNLSHIIGGSLVLIGTFLGERCG